MDDFPTKIADSLEALAQKIRSMTVDRVRNVAKWAALGMLLTVLVILAVVFLLLGLFRILNELIRGRTAWAALGGLFVVAGAFLWGMRIPREPKEAAEDE